MSSWKLTAQRRLADPIGSISFNSDALTSLRDIVYVDSLLIPTAPPFFFQSLALKSVSNTGFLNEAHVWSQEFTSRVLRVTLLLFLLLFWTIMKNDTDLDQNGSNLIKVDQDGLNWIKWQGLDKHGLDKHGVDMVLILIWNNPTRVLYLTLDLVMA